MVTTGRGAEFLVLAGNPWHSAALAQQPANAGNQVRRHSAALPLCRDDDARELDIERAAFRHSDNLMQSGVRHALNGLTTSEEILRTCRQSGESDGGV